jgi:hypothetical protein
MRSLIGTLLGLTCSSFLGVASGFFVLLMTSSLVE